MKDLTLYSSINVFVGPRDALQMIPEINRHYALIFETNPRGQIIEATYGDPMGNFQSIEINIKPDKLSEFNRLANDSTAACKLMHLQPAQIQNFFPKLLSNVIKTEQDYAQQFFAADSNKNKKFSRKQSGLSHSYLYDPELGVIQLANKDECRVVWSESVPTPDIFYNLPKNTVGAYVVVNRDVYYIDNKPNALPEKISSRIDLPVFEPYRLTTQGLPASVINTLPPQARPTVHSKRYGKGAVGTVKPSQANLLGGETNIASKIQKLTSDSKTIQHEADILYDLKLGSKTLRVYNGKVVLHMRAKGQSLPKLLSNASLETKIDYAIKFLIAVNDLHTGVNSRTHQKYAHRDLKPDNILVDKDGHLTLIDYGLSTTVLDTKNALPAGTLRYAPLDQAVIDRYAREDSLSDSETNESVVNFDDDELATDNATDNAINDQLPADWLDCLYRPWLCSTTNYLQDDKVAALRTIYNPSKKPGASIFNTQEFGLLPQYIQQLFDSSKVSRVLARRDVTEEFLAAALIRYQQNPNVPERELDALSLNPQEQQQIIMKYQLQANQPNSPAVTDTEDLSSSSSEKTQPPQGPKK
jgi:serine/threonine protein kinase